MSFLPDEDVVEVPDNSGAAPPVEGAEEFTKADTPSSKGHRSSLLAKLRKQRTVWVVAALVLMIGVGIAIGRGMKGSEASGPDNRVVAPDPEPRVEKPVEPPKAAKVDPEPEPKVEPKTEPEPKIDPGPNIDLEPKEQAKLAPASKTPVKVETPKRPRPTAAPPPGCTVMDRLPGGKWAPHCTQGTRKCTAIDRMPSGRWVPGCTPPSETEFWKK